MNTNSDKIIESIQKRADAIVTSVWAESARMKNPDEYYSQQIMKVRELKLVARKIETGEKLQARDIYLFNNHEKKLFSDGM